MLRKLKDLLRAADLSHEESLLYLLLLKNGASSIPSLKTQSGLPNITVYRSLQRLTDRGLLKVTPINQKQSLYAPLSLEKLVRAIDKEQRRLRRLELALRGLDRLLPHIDLNAENDCQEIEVREGIDAFKEEYLKMPEIFHDEYLHLGNTERFWTTAKLNYDAPEERAFLHKRWAKNLYARALDVRTPTSELIQKRDSLEKRTLRFNQNLPIQNDFMMIADKQVSHFVNDPDNPRVIVIRNPEMVQGYRSQFDQLWQTER